MTKKPQIIQLNQFNFPEIDFYISVAELNQQFSFEIKRVYFLKSGSQDLQRGNHAHKNAIQLLIGLSGDIMVSLTDQKGDKKLFELNVPNIGLVVPPLHWIEIELPKNSILLCLSSQLYKKQATYYNYKEFIQND